MVFHIDVSLQPSIVCRCQCKSLYCCDFSYDICIEGEQQLISSHGVELLVTIINKHITNESVVEAAVGALANACSPDGMHMATFHVFQVVFIN